MPACCVSSHILDFAAARQQAALIHMHLGCFRNGISLLRIEIPRKIATLLRSKGLQFKTAQRMWLSTHSFNFYLLPALTTAVMLFKSDLNSKATVYHSQKKYLYAVRVIVRLPTSSTHWQRCRWFLFRGLRIVFTEGGWVPSSLAHQYQIPLKLTANRGRRGVSSSGLRTTNTVQDLRRKREITER